MIQAKNAVSSEVPARQATPQKPKSSPFLMDNILSGKGSKMVSGKNASGCEVNFAGESFHTLPVCSAMDRSRPMILNGKKASDSQIFRRTFRKTWLSSNRKMISQNS